MDASGYVCMYCGSRQSTSTPGRVRCAVCGRDTFGTFQARANALWRDGLKAQLQHDAQQSESASSPAVEVAGRPSAATAAEQPDATAALEDSPATVAAPALDWVSEWTVCYRSSDEHVWQYEYARPVPEAVGDAITLLLRGRDVRMVREP